MTHLEQVRARALDAGLLVLRLGGLTILALLFAWGRFPDSAVAGISDHSSRVAVVAVLGVLTALGLVVRPSAIALAAAMVWSCAHGWRIGQQFLEEPVRAFVLFILYSTLACTGAGRWSIDQLVTRSRAAEHILKPLARRVDAGLLLLRLGTGISLFAFFGVTKIGWILIQLHAPQPWSQWDFARLIAAVGFPAPFLLSVCAVANETIIPLLVAAGVVTRPAAALGAIGMSGTMYTSLRLHEEPLRAATYLVCFAALALTGAGRYSMLRPPHGPRT